MPRVTDVKREFPMDSFVRLFDMIGVLARRRYQEAERWFRELGLNHTEARLLTLLNEEGGSSTQEALSNLLLVDRSNAGRALKRLEQGDYVVRQPDEADKRTNLVRMTAKGREAVGELSVYVDGMNGLIQCNEIIQWLYQLTASKV